MYKLPSLSLQKGSMSLQQLFRKGLQCLCHPPGGALHEFVTWLAVPNLKFQQQVLDAPVLPDKEIRHLKRDSRKLGIPRGPAEEESLRRMEHNQCKDMKEKMERILRRWWNKTGNTGLSKFLQQIR